MPIQARFIWPNLLTCVSIGVGLASIAEAIAGHLHSSAWLMLLCVLLDKLDGTVARLLKASSRFGVEMDSLSDLITFGVAPAALTIAALSGPTAPASLSAIPYFRVMVYGSSFLYAICAALRLAKFNVMTDELGPDYFFGIPTTLCGGLVGSYHLTVAKYALPWQTLAALPAVMTICGLLMVSNVPLPKLKVRKSLPLNIFVFGNVAAVYVCGFTRLFPEYLLTVAVSYMVCGSLISLVRGVGVPRR